MNAIKDMTTHDLERIVLASMIAPETAKAANKATKAAKFKPEEMFADADTRREYDILVHHGAAVFDGHLGGVPLEKLATADVAEHVKRLKADYTRRLAETDRTLDQFETPGPDSEDPDCLFQNRWLRRGMCGAIVSTSGVGKSSFSMQAATVWAGGQECLGVRPLRPLKIGIFQSEDDEYDVANFRDRIRIGLAAELDWTPEQIQAAESRVTFCALDGSTGARFVEYLRRKQTQHHFDLIIVNPLFAFFGGDMNDGNAMTAFLRHGIDPLIKSDEAKCGCIIVHHTGKPNKDALNQGEIFKAYLGSGSGEFTNYIRSALVLTPWNGGKLPGVFDLIAAKHGDKLAWRDIDGKPTTKKTVCYANRLPEYADDETKRGMIYWTEPDAAQFAELKKTANAATTAKTNQPPPVARCAAVVAELIPHGMDGGSPPRERQERPTAMGIQGAELKTGWRGWKRKTYKMVTAWPKCHDPEATAEVRKGVRDLWAEYWDVFQAEKAADRLPHIAANRFYRKHRKAMDEGAAVLNPRNFDPATEVSGIQHAMNILLRDGEATFMSEYQMQPPRSAFAFELTARHILSRIRRGVPPKTIPPATVFTAAATDINPGYAITTAITTFDIRLTALVTAYHVTRIRIPENLNDTEFNARLFAALKAHAREIVAQGIPLDKWGIDAGGRQFNTVTAFAPTPDGVEQIAFGAVYIRPLVSKYRAVVAAVETALQNYGNNPNKTIAVGELSITYKDYADLLAILAYWRRRADEDETGQQPKAGGPKFAKVRFV